MLTLGGDPLSVDLLVQDYSGHLFPGGFLIAWLNTHLAPLDWSVAVVEIVVLQLVASVLAWLVLCRLLPGSWWRLPVLSAYLFCPLSLWPTQWWAVAIQYLPVSIFLFLATWALLHRLQDGSRWSGPLVVLATVRWPAVPGAGRPLPDRAGLRGDRVRRGRGATPHRRGPPRPPRGLGAPRGAPAGLRVAAPRAGADRSHVRGFAGRLGRARGQLRRSQRRAGVRRRTVGRPGTVHHRGPDRLGGNPELGRRGGGGRLDPASIRFRSVGLAAAPDLHGGGRGAALRRSHRSRLRRGVGADPSLRRRRRPGAGRRPRPGGQGHHGRVPPLAHLRGKDHEPVATVPARGPASGLGAGLPGLGCRLHGRRGATLLQRGRPRLRARASAPTCGPTLGPCSTTGWRRTT